MSNNKIILGTVQMGLPYGINNSEGQISIQNSFDILKYAHQHGITSLDTAHAYGNAHEVIGKFHLQFKEHAFKIITKLPHEINGDINDIITSFLQQLRVNHLEVLLFHSYQSYKKNNHLKPLIKKAKEERKIVQTGVSVYTNDEFKELIEDEFVDVIQLPFNLLDNYNIRGELLKKAKDKQKTIHTRSCFLQGLFFLPDNNTNKIALQLKNELRIIHKLARENDLSVSKLSLLYCLQQPEIDGVLIGVDSIEHLKQNISDTQQQLAAPIIDSINDIKVSNTQLLNPSLWNLL